MPAQPSSSMGTALCQRCRFMFSNEGLPDLADPRGRGFHHSLMSSFSERPDCTLCSYMWNENLVAVWHVEPLMGLRELPRRYKIDPTTSTVVFKILHIEPPEVRSFASFAIWVVSPEGRLRWGPREEFILAASEGDPFAQHTDRRPIRWEGLTEEFVAAMKEVLAKCEQSHDDCKPSGPVPLPTRVLRIMPQRSSSPRVHLYVSPEVGVLGRYACLSYCWGRRSSQPVELTKDNMQNLQTNGLDVNTLPLTLKDAVLTTQCLGLQYLWIDALCIIQDDEEDKKREIARMGSIYSNCTVCIAAATGKSVRDGFLKPAHQTNPRYPDCKITLPPGHNDRFHGTMIITLPHKQETEDFAINKRGWTYQEAVLPPRTLVFGDIEPVLRCRTDDATQILKADPIHYYEYDALAPKRISEQIFDERSVSNLAKSVQLAAELWPEVVQEYSCRRLTKAEDKPVAIQGVMDLFASQMEEKCYFGIWRSWPPGLLWRALPGCSRDEDAGSGNEDVVSGGGGVGSGDEGNNDLYDDDSEAPRRIPGLPSWSWMSLTGGTQCVGISEVMKGSQEAKIRFEADGCSPPTYSRLRITCRVLTAAEVKRANAFTEFNADVPFELDMESTVQWLKRHELSWKLMDILQEYDLGLIRTTPIAELYMTIEESKLELYVLVICTVDTKHKEHMEFWLLNKKSRKGAKDRRLLGILVERVRDNVYRRVGRVEVRALKRWWRCRSTVVLI